MYLYAGLGLNLCQALARGIDMSNGLSAEDVHDVLELGGLPSRASVGPEPAKRFDLLILRAQVALPDGDTADVDRIRETVTAGGEPNLRIPVHGRLPTRRYSLR